MAHRVAIDIESTVPHLGDECEVRMLLSKSAQGACRCKCKVCKGDVERKCEMGSVCGEEEEWKRVDGEFMKRSSRGEVRLGRKDDWGGGMKRGKGRRDGNFQLFVYKWGPARHRYSYLLAGLPAGNDIVLSLPE
jgi:hypothetical protein